MRRFRTKFGNRRTATQGRTYDSKAEARYADALAARVKAGEVLFWWEQVPIRLPGGTKYVADFVVFEADGTMRVQDVKGVETPEFRIKKREIEALYPFDIEVITMPKPPRTPRPRARKESAK